MGVQTSQLARLAYHEILVTLWPGCFLDSCLDIATTYSFCFKTSAEKSSWTKIYCVVYGKLPLECCLFQLWNFSLFSASLMMVVFIEMGYQAICVFTNTMNSSAQLKDRELRLLVLFLLIILLLYTIEMRSSAALECATFVCFLRKLCVWEKICSKFVKPWEMKKLL